MSVDVPGRFSIANVLGRVSSCVPQAFHCGVPKNLIDGVWTGASRHDPIVSPVDGSAISALPRVDSGQALRAVRAAAAQHRAWGIVPLDERRRRVGDAVDAMTELRQDLAMLLGWEIGKPWKLACADVDRSLDGVRWYLDQIDFMLATDATGQPADRRPLPGPVSNIASWNYPMSVLVHAELVQMLAGNAVIAKTPSQGGALCLAVAHAVMAEMGLPVTLLSGSGSELSAALVRSPEVGAVAFVGGRANGARVSSQLAGTATRYIMEQEGLNTWGVWEFSDWEGFSRHLRKGFEYAKQRCTAYPRFVVQRKLVDQFLETYLRTVSTVRVGHPFAIEPGTVAGSADELLPELDFGPLISASKAVELDARVDEALKHGAVPLYRGELDDSLFVSGQDRSAYRAPVTLLAPPGVSRLMHEEPFGPVDTIVVVDTEAELLSQMNASNGALVASIASDHEDWALSLSVQLQAFKVGINQPRSRGDKSEPFGGRGGAWKGAFVGGEHLVHAVTLGPAGEQLHGNFPDYSRYPVNEPGQQLEAGAIR